MVKLDLNTIRKKFSEKQNEELLKILSDYQEDYQPEVINTIKEILLDRGIESNLINSKVELFEEKKINSLPFDNKGKNSFQRWLIRLLLLILLYFGVRLLLKKYILSNIIVVKKESFWNTDYVYKFKKSLYSFYSSLIQNDYNKEKCAICTIEKFENNFPNGLEGIVSDSLQRIMIKYSTYCAKSLKIDNVKWPTTYKDSLIKSMMKEDILSGPNVDERKSKKFCNYYVDELEKYYPFGVYEVIPIEIQDSISKAYFSKDK